MSIIDYKLPDSEYYKEICDKDTIYIHHTAGGHRPDYSIAGWAHDKSKNGGQLPVGTAYVIGGISSVNGKTDFDGIIYQAFEDKYWAHHLGLETTNNKLLNQKSIGIEVCNYGPLTKTKDGLYLNYVNKTIPATMVGELAQPYRGFKYYHKYTDLQLRSLHDLMLDIARRYPKINLKNGLQLFISQGAGAFEINQGALKGVPGVWSHSNVRKDKFDMWPQPQLIDLIKQF